MDTCFSALHFAFWGLLFITFAVNSSIVLSSHHSAGLDDNITKMKEYPNKMRIYVYDIPTAYNKRVVQRDPRCVYHMFATEIYMHTFLLSSEYRTLDPENADWFFTPVYTNCDLTENGLPLIDNVPWMMNSAVQYISTKWPYWNKTQGADHIFVVPHDFGACFHYKEKEAIQRGILPLLQKATLLQTFGQKNHPCMKENSIIIPPYVPPTRITRHQISPGSPRSTFVYFRGAIYDPKNDPIGFYYARGVRAAIWENFKDNPMFDISNNHPVTYYEDMQHALFCLCPLGWAPWSPRIVEAAVSGCIPVIIADDIVLPFEDIIPWKKVAVFVSEKDVNMLEDILTSMPASDVMEKQALLENANIRESLLFPRPSVEGDAFHHIMAALAEKLESQKHNWTIGAKQEILL